MRMRVSPPSGVTLTSSGASGEDAVTSVTAPKSSGMIRSYPCLSAQPKSWSTTSRTRSAFAPWRATTICLASKRSEWSSPTSPNSPAIPTPTTVRPTAAWRAADNRPSSLMTPF